MITSLVKKPNLDPDLMNNYRPISNLSFVSSKLLELHVPVQLRQTTTIYRTFFKSAYCQHHSTETAFARIQNDHLNSADRKRGVLTVLLDMSAAFYPVDHSLLIGQMRSIGPASKWLESYISNRTHTVHIGSHNSHRTLIESGIP